jgi:hypothetical protein
MPTSSRLRKCVQLVAVVAMGTLVLAGGPAAAGVKVGDLQCQVGVGVGLIVMEKEKLLCTFHSNTGATEHYHGLIRKFGLEVGVTGGSIIVWAVAAATNDYNPGSRAGKYVGASGDVTAGLGVGANALVGGSNKSFALQPLSVQGQVGVDLGLGISAMDLDAR